MVNILLIGGGAREHAIAEAIMRSHHKPKLHVFMPWKNPGIEKLSEQVFIGKMNDLDGMLGFAGQVKPEFCIIGPEAPLAEGIADLLWEKGIPCVGPKRNLAKIETSKSFTRHLMQKYKIPGLPKFYSFDSMDGIEEFLDMLAEQGKGFVIKPDGLTSGKGVKVQGDHLSNKFEALAYCAECLKAGNVVIEEKLIGEEFSQMCFTDGKTVIAMPIAQDHKRAFDGDNGPNTGGMGSYSDSNHLLPFVRQVDFDAGLEISRLVTDALYQETGEYYMGILYGGFIVTKDGVKLIEYNARFGDPEAMNVLPTLTTDFVEICRSIVKQDLGGMTILWENKATVCKYLVPEGYPDKPVKGAEFEMPVSHSDNLKVYYASVEKTEKGKLVTLGSRAVGFVGLGDNIADAETRAEHAIAKISGQVFHRKDIGTKALLEKRVEHQKKIRGE